MFQKVAYNETLKELSRYELNDRKMPVFSEADTDRLAGIKASISTDQTEARMRAHFNTYIESLVWLIIRDNERLGKTTGYSPINALRDILMHPVVQESRTVSQSELFGFQDQNGIPLVSILYGYIKRIKPDLFDALFTPSEAQFIERANLSLYSILLQNGVAEDKLLHDKHQEALIYFQKISNKTSNHKDIDLFEESVDTGFKSLYEILAFICNVLGKVRRPQGKLFFFNPSFVPDANDKYQRLRDGLAKLALDISKQFLHLTSEIRDTVAALYYNVSFMKTREKKYLRKILLNDLQQISSARPDENFMAFVDAALFMPTFEKMEVEPNTEYLPILRREIKHCIAMVTSNRIKETLSPLLDLLEPGLEFAEIKRYLTQAEQFLNEDRRKHDHKKSSLNIQVKAALFMITTFKKIGDDIFEHKKCPTPDVQTNSEAQDNNAKPLNLTLQQPHLLEAFVKRMEERFPPISGCSRKLT